jgi:hypothetical protein
VLPELGYETVIPSLRELDAYIEMLWAEEGSDMADDLSWEALGLLSLWG